MIGNAGEHCVYAELCRRNILALITSKKELRFRFFDFRYFKKKDHNRRNKWRLLGFK